MLVYLNDDWQEDWGGSLELWRTLSDGPVQSIVPLMNRMAVFSTPGAPHGHPKPITAPAGRSRLCFSAYYFTSPDTEDAPTESHGVLFSAAPEGTSGSRRRRGWFRRWRSTAQSPFGVNCAAAAPADAQSLAAALRST